ncbi:MAG TPA: mechanosensitive ion channel domain-containing protein [Acidimicrobiales bacterium]|nr:mechanosensitive ion channel domain-containing protein [Acidimicrobiales bacterium]
MPPTTLTAADAGKAGSGDWLYQLLVKSGVTPSTAHSVDNFVVRPLEVVLVVVVAVLVAHFGARAIRRLLGKVARQAADRSGGDRAGTRAATVVALVGNLWRFFVGVVAFFIVLGMLGINLTPLLASATVIGATIGFGAQALVRDYLSGFLLTMEDQFGIGDTVTVGSVTGAGAITGVVEDVSLRVTRVRAFDGTIWYVPNGDIRELANASRGWARAVVDVPVPVEDPATLDRIRDLAADAAREVAARPPFAGASTDPPEVIGLVGAATDHCTLRIAVRTSPALHPALERALREAVVGRLAEAGLWPAPPAAS